MASMCHASDMKDSSTKIFLDMVSQLLPTGCRLFTVDSCYQTSFELVVGQVNPLADAVVFGIVFRLLLCGRLCFQPFNPTNTTVNAMTSFRLQIPSQLSLISSTSQTPLLYVPSHSRFRHRLTNQNLDAESNRCDLIGDGVLWVIACFRMSS